MVSFIEIYKTAVSRLIWILGHRKYKDKSYAESVAKQMRLIVEKE